MDPEVGHLMPPRGLKYDKCVLFCILHQNFSRITSRKCKTSNVTVSISDGKVLGHGNGFLFLLINSADKCGTKTVSFPCFCADQRYVLMGVKSTHVCWYKWIYNTRLTSITEAFVQLIPKVATLKMTSCDMKVFEMLYQLFIWFS